MARKTTKQASTPVADQTDDAPVLDTSNTAVKALIKKGKERGFVTHDELNSALPQGELTSEQIEDVMASLSQMGVNVVEATDCLLYTSPSPRDEKVSRMPSSA